MDVLVLGGTVFLGRAVVAETLATGANVTIFNRGMSGPAPRGVEQITGDRTVPADLAALSGRHFDVVVDTSGYVPAEVTLSASLLAPTCGHYAFVSTVNVFPGWPEAPDYRAVGVHDGDPDATRGDAPDEESAYGWVKAGCELAVVRAFGTDRSSLLRAGCIVGPDDSRVGRLSWWIDRVARGGEVLVPGRPQDPMSLIDSRDLARFALAAAPGAFETCGADSTRGELMDACRSATGSDAAFTWVDDAWLQAQDVEPWTEIPLWVPAAEAPSAFAHDPVDAVMAGLRCRPLLETVADTWAWQRAGWQPTERTPGLDAAKEAALLKQWHAR
jgi:nucleoside-diphosphate-sugar epimerase